MFILKFSSIQKYFTHYATSYFNILRHLRKDKIQIGRPIDIRINFCSKLRQMI